MRTEVFNGIETVDQTLWDHVSQGRPYAGWRWCLYGEAVNRLPGYYAVVYEGDKPIGGAIISVMRKEAIPTRNKMIRWLLQQYFQRRPLIVCRTATTTNHKGLFLPDDPTLQVRVLRELRGVMSDITRQNNGSFFLADYLHQHDLIHDWDGFFPLADFSKEGTQMIVEWDTWDEFMTALRARSKKQHKNARNNTRYAQEMGITITFNDPPPTTNLIPLIKGYWDKYRAAFDPQHIANNIAALSCLEQQNYVWVTAELDGKTVACEVLLFDEKNRVSRPILYGRDYNVPYVYFYLAYEDIRYAIEELRAKTIIYDTDAYEFKRRIGFTDDPRNHLVFYPGSRLERRLASVLMRFMND